MKQTWRFISLLAVLAVLVILVRSGSSTSLHEVGIWGYGPALYHIQDPNGHWNYVLSGRNFVVLDSAGQKVGAAPLSGLGKQLIQSGRYVYIVTYNGIFVADVGNPFSPVITAGGDYFGAFGMAVQQDPNNPNAFVTGYDYTSSSPFVGSLNLQNPASPTLQSKLEINSYPYTIAVDSAGFIFTGSYNGIGVYDGTDVNNIKPLPSSGLTSYTHYLSPPTTNGIMLASGETSLQVFDINNPNQLVKRTEFTGLLPSGAMASANIPNQILVPLGDSGFQQVDARDVNNISPGTWYQTGSMVNGISAGAGNTLQVAGGREGAWQYSYSGTDKVVPDWHYSTPYNTRGVLAGPGGKAWSLDNTFTLWSIDMSNMTNGSTAGTLQIGSNPMPTSNKQMGLAVDSSGWLYISGASSSTGIAIIDPNYLTLTNTITGVGIPAGISFTNSGGSKAKDSARKLLFTASGSGGMYIVDVTNPASPQKLGNYNTSGTATGVTVSGNTAFIADGLKGLVIVDVSNPASPKWLGTCDTPGFANRVAVAGNVAAVADASNGLVLIDITDPKAPKVLGSYKPAGGFDALDVLVRGRYAYLACSHWGLHIVNIIDPKNPRQALHHAPLDAVISLTELDGLIYMAIEGAGVSVVESLPEPNGDVDWNGITDMQDLLIMRLVAGGVLAPAALPCRVQDMGDFDGNGVIDPQDCANLAAVLVENIL